MKYYIKIDNLVPVAKARPRFRYNRSRKNFTCYTPQKTKIYEEVLKYYAMQLRIPKELKDKPVSLDIQFLFPNKKQTWLGCKISKPDIDNLIKSVLDGLNKIVYNDDRQVYKIIASKYYRVDIGRGSTLITIEYL